MKKTLVIGASPKEERYSNKAARLLIEKGHEVQLLGNRVSAIDDYVIHKDWEALDLENLDTVTLYLGVKHQGMFFDKIIELKPKRVIFNPGTENSIFYKILTENNIEYEEACTLVLLNLGAY